VLGKASLSHGSSEAAKVRDQIRAIGALYSGTQDVNYYKEAEQLQRALALLLRLCLQEQAALLLQELLTCFSSGFCKARKDFRL